jgi:hypothetical protein
MKLLFENWRQYLNEAAKAAQDLPDGVFVRISPVTDELFTIFYAQADGSAAGIQRAYPPFRAIPPDVPWGEIELQSVVEDEYGPCDGAWVIIQSEAKSGWGPMLYDVAMEYATINGNGLIADRSSVSDDAHRVWSYYLDNRARLGVTAHQLDDLKNTLTPEEEDNCEYTLTTGAADHVDWIDSPLSKRYTKPPATIEKLQAAGKLQGLDT